MTMRWSFGLGIVLAAGVAVAADGASSLVTVTPPAGVTGEANAPTPPADAAKKASIGKGKVAAGTANAAADGDSFWVEEVDVDGDGTVETADLLWDDEDKVLLLYAAGDFKCANGKMGSGDLLVAVNGQGNPRGRPAGSGFYMVGLDEGECGAKAAGVYGCRFDAKGNPTACGVATLDEKNDDLVIVTAEK